MSETLSRLAASKGAPGWRLVLDRLHLIVEASTFPEAVDFVSAVAGIAEAQQHHPDIDVRYRHVHLAVSTHDVDGITERDLALAEEITEEVRVRGLTVHVPPITEVQIAIDCTDADEIAPFWAGVLGYERVDRETLRDPLQLGPEVWLQEGPDAASERGRFHLDVAVAHDEVDDRLASALAAGGTIVRDDSAPSYVTVVDPAGNLACLCTWVGRDEGVPAAARTRDDLEALES